MLLILPANTDLELLILLIYTFCLLIMFLAGAGQMALLYYYRKSATASAVSPSQTEYPFVTIQLPVYNERYVIERLLDAAGKLDYPADKYEIQVLDDSDDDTSVIIAGKLPEFRSKGINVIHLQRKERTGYKAGALQYGLERANGEYIAIFDADFIPEPGFLLSTLHHFNSASTGMVQTRWGHLNPDYSILTRILHFGLDGHFTIEQKGRNAAGAYINFNGTAGIWRKKCIEESGGWHFDTLTEDLDLSYRAQLKGWKFTYCEDIVTPAELPVDMFAIKSQQYRWTKGGVETTRKVFGLLWKSPVPLKNKLFGSLHLLGNYLYLLIFIAALASIPLLFIDHSEWYTFFTPLLLLLFLFNTVFYYTSFRKANPVHSLKKFAGIFPLFISVSLGMSLHNSIAVLEGIFKKSTPFIRTPKFNILNRKVNWKENSYRRPKLTILNFAEGLLSLCFLTAAFAGAGSGEFSFFLFHLMMSTGFGAVCFYSVSHASQGIP